ncbi:MAG: COX15/CtaA family protein, partial [Rhodoferax sp.]
VTLGDLVWRLWPDKPLHKPLRWLLALLLLQALTGVSNVVLGWPMLAAVLHTGGAGAMVLLLVRLLCLTRSHLAGQAHEIPAVAS